MKSIPRSFITIFGLLVLPPLIASARDKDWPQFRGVAGSGISTSERLPLEWGPDKNLAWSQPIPGSGWSSPIIVGDRIFLTTAIPDKLEAAAPKGMRPESVRYSVPDITYDWRVLCLSLADGELLWEKSLHVGKARHGKHTKNSYATETPASDGKHLFVYFSQLGLFAFDLDGNSLWSAEPGSFETYGEYGGSSSPVTDGKRVYLQCDNEEKSFVIAYDAATGEVCWKTDRETITSWSTPLLWKNSMREELVTLSPHRAYSYDPATGKVLWELGGMSKLTVPVPVADERHCYLSSGMLVDPRHRPIFAIRPGASGDITPGAKGANAFIAWQNAFGGPYVPSPIAYHGHLFIVHDRPLFDCLSLQDGKPMYRRQRLPHTGNFTASPVAYRDHILCLAEEGDTYLIEASKDFKVAVHNPSLDEEGLFLATPALSEDSIVIRGARRLHCVRVSEAQ